MAEETAAPDPQEKRIADLEDMVQQLHGRLYQIERALARHDETSGRDIGDLLFGDGWVEQARRASGWATAQHGARPRRGARAQ